MFRDIKVGDEVGIFVPCGFDGDVATTIKVTRITPKRFQIGGKSTQYEKKDGYQYGGSPYNRGRCHKFDEKFRGLI